MYAFSPLCTSCLAEQPMAQRAAGVSSTPAVVPTPPGQMVLSCCDWCCHRMQSPRQVAGEAFHHALAKSGPSGLLSHGQHSHLQQ